MKLMYLTKMSSFPNRTAINSASAETLTTSATSATSNWRKITLSDRPQALILSTASVPRSTFLAVKITKTSLVANCLHISKPIPLFPPVSNHCVSEIESHFDLILEVENEVWECEDFVEEEGKEHYLVCSDIVFRNWMRCCVVEWIGKSVGRCCWCCCLFLLFLLMAKNIF